LLDEKELQNQQASSKDAENHLGFLRSFDIHELVLIKLEE
jgi:hypothetical protein